jgi:hypothetical protein
MQFSPLNWSKFNAIQIILDGSKSHLHEDFLTENMETVNEIKRISSKNSNELPLRDVRSLLTEVRDEELLSSPPDRNILRSQRSTEQSQASQCVQLLQDLIVVTHLEVSSS